MFVHEFENPLFEFEAAGPQNEPLFALPPTYRRRLSLGPYISFSLCPYIFPLSFYLFSVNIFLLLRARAFRAPCFRVLRVSLRTVRCPWGQRARPFRASPQ